ncbi:MAG: hypothetical protein KME52_15040 [Desmonostoc geniculatum HA4340-LM1]|nr:hypothetical protein [Desmonostoc geniculatum HA4340-LM1]
MAFKEEDAIHRVSTIAAIVFRSHFHPVQNICFIKGDRLCPSFAHDNQSTWKNFYSFV